MQASNCENCERGQFLTADTLSGSRSKRPEGLRDRLNVAMKIRDMDGR